MKKLVLFCLALLAYTSIFASEVRLTNGVSFDMPNGYEYFKHKTFPYSAKRGNDVLYLSAIYGDKFDKTVFYTSADTICYNLSRANMVCEKHSKIWKFSKKYVKRYYKLSKDSYAVTYSCHTESKAGFVMLATYSTTKQLKELEDMFGSIRLSHKNFFREFIYTFGNGSWIFYIILFIILCVELFIPKNSWLEIILAFLSLGIFIFFGAGMAVYTLIVYIVSTVPIFLLYLHIEDHLPERFKRKQRGGNNSGDDGGDDGGDEGNDDNGYVTSDDGSYYNPIDFN